MKTSGEPVKRIPVTVQYDESTEEDIAVTTDRAGEILLEKPAVSGRILIDGRPHYQGPLNDDVEIR